jgi:hypothetical protein
MGIGTGLEYKRGHSPATFVESTFNHISRVLMRHNIKTVGLLPRKITSFLQPIKNDLGLRTMGIYSILSECGKISIGQTSVPLILASGSTTSTSGFIIQTN